MVADNKSSISLKCLVAFMIIFMFTTQLTDAAPSRVMMRFGKRLAPSYGNLFEGNQDYYQGEPDPEEVMKLHTYLSRNQMFPIVFDD
uniref:Uncharacterized protein n=1 Tax=Rhabditophanes sp. KR3021 TaxID=114890 RepID=A0AC35U4U8_9BILA